MMSYLERQISKVNGTGPLVRPRPRARFENPNALDSGALMPMTQAFDSDLIQPSPIPDNQPPGRPENPRIQHGKQAAAQSASVFTEKPVATNKRKHDVIAGNEQHPVNQEHGSVPEEQGGDAALCTPGITPAVNTSQNRNDRQVLHTAGPPKKGSEGRQVRSAPSPPRNIHLNRFEETPPPADPHPEEAGTDSGNIVFLEKDVELPPLSAVSPGVSNRSVLPQENQSGQRMPDMNISIEIGKVVVENPSPPTPQTFSRPAFRKPGMSLSDYLEKRSGGNR